VVWVLLFVMVLLATSMLMHRLPIVPQQQHHRQESKDDHDVTAAATANTANRVLMEAARQQEPETIRLDERGVVVSEPFQDKELQMPTEPCHQYGPAGWKPGEPVTDSRGYVCSYNNLHEPTRCCLSRVRHSCLMCQVEKGCCYEYARCVSCCMGNLTATSWDECRHLCRTSSSSLLELSNVRRWDSDRPKFCFRGWRSAEWTLNQRDLRPEPTLVPCVKIQDNRAPPPLVALRRDSSAPPLPPGKPKEEEEFVEI